MKILLWCYGTHRAGLVAGLLVFFMALMVPAAQARIVESTEIKQTNSGYDIIIQFTMPLGYQSHTPKRSGDTLTVQLRPTGGSSLQDSDVIADLSGRSILSWDRTTGIPLVEIIYEGGLASQPELSFKFSKRVEFDVRSARDLRSLIVSIRLPVSKRGEEKPPAAEDIKSLYDSGDIDEAFRDLFDGALRAIEEGKYGHAIQIYTKIAEEADGRTRQKAIELLGLAYEKNGQLAHAKAEYERYLELYPEAPEAERVRQRLLGILTAHIKPGEKEKPDRAGKPGGLEWRAWGGLSQFYFRDQTTPENEDTQLNRSALNTAVDLTTSGQTSSYSVRLRAIGGFDKDLRDEASSADDQGYISNLSIEGALEKPGLRAELGRQTLSSDGVTGRFDGIRTEWTVTPVVQLNAQFGYPVMSSRQSYIDQDRAFAGMSVDLGPFSNGWDVSGYFLEQRNNDLVDRRAVGGELKFSDADRSLFNRLELDTSLFTLVDYDVFYNNLNIFMFLGNWGLSTRTTLNVLVDYRNSPFLTTNNAIVGQGVEHLSDLIPTFTDNEIEQFAVDRTMRSQSATVGLTQEFGKRWQITGDISVFETDGMIASGGVEAVDPTGPDYYYSLQSIGNGLFMDNDIFIVGFRYGSTDRYDDYRININARFPVSREFRINPKLLATYRKGPDERERTIVRPLLRMDYLVRKWLRLELEVGTEFSQETAIGIDQSTTGVFVFAGYRSEF